jgi:hypothetical protein
MMKKIVKYVFILLMVVLVTASMMSISFAAIKMTPYLQAVTTNSVYVLAGTDSTSPVKAEYGTTTSYGNIAFTTSTEPAAASPATYVHNIKLTGLQANTNYHYRVSQGGTPSPDYSFWTATNPGNGCRFAWMADCRTGTAIHDAISSAISTYGPRFSLYGGDLCYDSSYNSFKTEFFRPNEFALISLTPANTTNYSIFVSPLQKSITSERGSSVIQL